MINPVPSLRVLFSPPTGDNLPGMDKADPVNRRELFVSYISVSGDIE